MLQLLYCKFRFKAYLDAKYNGKKVKIDKTLHYLNTFKSNSLVKEANEHFCKIKLIHSIALDNLVFDDE